MTVARSGTLEIDVDGVAARVGDSGGRGVKVAVGERNRDENTGERAAAGELGDLRSWAEDEKLALRLSVGSVGVEATGAEVSEPKKWVTALVVGALFEAKSEMDDSEERNGNKGIEERT